MASVRALTTTFTPSASCLKDYYRLNHTGTYTENSKILTYQYLSLGPASTSACLPAGFDSTSQYFSPGICPSGYSIACSFLATFSSNIVETQATCCPTGYTCQKGLDWPWYSTEACTLGTSTWVASITSDVRGGGTTTFQSTIYGMNAYGISIRYQSSDLPSSTTTTSSSSSSSSSSQTPSKVSSTTSSGVITSLTASPSTSASAQLPAAAIAGISVGAVCLLGIIGVLIWWLRKVKLEKQKSDPLMGGFNGGYPEYPNQHNGAYPVLPYQQQYLLAEMPVPIHPAELPSGEAANLHELGNSNSRWR